MYSLNTRTIEKQNSQVAILPAHTTLSTFAAANYLLLDRLWLSRVFDAPQPWSFGFPANFPFVFKAPTTCSEE